ncbi:MAG: hypothetical protein IPP71_00010 [Bacteroidetes bacterium]|nr:hypothetical protein [Bacteroidota bacterium]
MLTALDLVTYEKKIGGLTQGINNDQRIAWKPSKRYQTGIDRIMSKSLRCKGWASF